MPEDSDSNNGHHDVHCSEKNCYAAGHGFGRDDGKPYCRVHMSDHMKEPAKKKNEGNGMSMMGKARPTFRSSEPTDNSFRMLKFAWGGWSGATQAAHEARVGGGGIAGFTQRRDNEQQQEQEEPEEEEGQREGLPGTLGHEILEDQAEQQEQLTQGGQEGVTGPMSRFQAWDAEREPEWATRLGTRLRGG